MIQDVSAVGIEIDVLLQHGNGLLIQDGVQLLECHLLGTALVGLEQVVVQIFRNASGGDDLVAVGGKDDCFEFGELSIPFQAFDGLCQLIQILDVVALQVLQQIGNGAVLGPEDHLVPGSRFAQLLQNTGQLALCGGEFQSNTGFLLIEPLATSRRTA